MLEKIVIEQFINIIENPKIKDKLRDVKPKTLDNIVKKADEYVQFAEMDREVQNRPTTVQASGSEANSNSSSAAKFRNEKVQKPTQYNPVSNFRQKPSNGHAGYEWKPRC